VDRDQVLASLSADELRRVLANLQEEADRRRIDEGRTREERSGLTVVYMLSRVYTSRLVEPARLPDGIRKGIDVLLKQMPDVDLAPVVQRVREGWEPLDWLIRWAQEPPPGTGKEAASPTSPD
jgi:hypothetical protein